MVSQTREVATVVEAAPYLQADEVTLMKSTGDMLTLRGVGFSLSENDNVVILYPAGGLPSFAPTGRVVNSTFHVFRGGSIFMCMDAAVDTGPAVYLSPVEDHGVIPTIVSVDASTSGVMCTAGDMSGLLRFLFLCFLWFVV